jgi:hypothetical protein
MLPAMSARFTTPWCVCLLGVVTGLQGACSAIRYDPERATRLYPAGLHQQQTADIQVLRKGERIQIVNTSPRSFGGVASSAPPETAPATSPDDVVTGSMSGGVDVWINQRYVYNVAAIPSGATVTMNLDDFRDVRGEGLHPGGLLRQFTPTPVRLVELQLSDAEPLLGLVVIRSEPAE